MFKKGVFYWLIGLILTAQALAQPSTYFQPQQAMPASYSSFTPPPP